jgi:nucleosome assembly protein 1-like 1
MTTTEEKIQAEIEKAKGMKISELKMKLMAKGVLTTSFVEKSEIVRAYAEAVVKESESGGAFSGLGGLAAKNKAEEVEDDEVDDDDDAPITEGLPPYMKLRVEKLKEIHNEREVLMKEYLAERASLEAKYEKLSLPFFETRKEVIAGGMDAEIAAAATAAASKDGSDESAAGEATTSEETEKDTGIPQFWACAIHQMPVTQGLVSETDLECLGSYLEDIRCIGHENGEGFTLEFQFVANNDFFENTVLTKSYNVPNLLLADEPILKNVSGCEIQWKPGKCLTHKEVTRQQRGTGKNAGQIRAVTKTVRQDSFFHFFTPPKMPSMETASEEEVMLLEQAFEEDYDVAQAFRSHIVTKAVMWFAGDAMEQEMEAALEGMEWPSSAEGATATSS